MLKIPTAKAAKKELSITGEFADKNKTENLVKPAIAPPDQIAYKVLDRTLKRMPKPTAAQPHQKALRNMFIQSVMR
jgi:hypothetical protein